MQPSQLILYPQYGYGWSQVDGITRETPAPFMVRLVDELTDEQTGTVATVGHEFEGCAVTLSPRHVDQEGTLNVTVHGRATGWATTKEPHAKMVDT